MRSPVGEVIQLPVVRTCFVCEHHFETESMSVCRLYDEAIPDETYTARRCASYEPA